MPGRQASPGVRLAYGLACFIRPTVGPLFQPPYGLLTGPVRACLYVGYIGRLFPVTGKG
jgi:hypothetical protein